MDTYMERPAVVEQDEGVAGIVIRDRFEPQRQPVISAFIWGGKVRQLPTLPFGRWKQTAA